MKRRRLKQGFAALAATAFVLPLASAGAAPPKLPGLTLVSQDTIVDGLALHQSEAQPSLAADGSKQRLVGAFEVGRIYNGGSSAIGFARSDDGGKAWQDGLAAADRRRGQATTSAGTVWRGADPSAAYDESHGLWLISSTGLGSHRPARSGCSSTARRTARSGPRRSSRTAQRHGRRTAERLARLRQRRRRAPATAPATSPTRTRRRPRRTSSSGHQVDGRRRDVVGSGRDA